VIAPHSISVIRTSNPAAITLQNDYSYRCGAINAALICHLRPLGHDAARRLVSHAPRARMHAGRRQ
jgi:hypothetical protein